MEFAIPQKWAGTMAKIVVLAILTRFIARHTHSNSSDLTNYIHFIIIKLRIMNIVGILLAVEKELDPLPLSQLTTFADDWKNC